jgi:hypothetical protein
MSTYGKLPGALDDQLRRIPPSRDGELQYYPCQVILRDGRSSDRVYVVEYGPYIRKWGVTPGQDPGKAEVRVEELTGITESPSRLPASMANRLYQAGESGMGYCVFTVVFRDGSRRVFVSGNAVDFIEYPEGFTPQDVLDVIPHAGRQDPTQFDAPGNAWCLYDGVEGAS